MPTKSHVLPISRASGKEHTPDVRSVQNKLDELLKELDAAGEEIVSVTPLTAGTSGTRSAHSSSNAPETGFGYSYTSALVIITRTS